MNNYEQKLEELKEELVSDIDSIIEGTYIVEGKVSSKEDLMGYAMTLAKNAFGDEVDESKVESIVDNAIEKSDGDWAEAAGIVTGSFNEQVEEEITEGMIPSKGFKIPKEGKVWEKWGNWKAEYKGVFIGDYDSEDEATRALELDIDRIDKLKKK